MKGKLLFMVGLFLLAVTDLKGEGKDSIPHFSISQKSVYSFIIQDSPARLFTMRQFDEDYLSGYRLYSKMMEDFFSPRLKFWIHFIGVLCSYLYSLKANYKPGCFCWCHTGSCSTRTRLSCSYRNIYQCSRLFILRSVSLAVPTLLGNSLEIR